MIRLEFESRSLVGKARQNASKSNNPFSSKAILKRIQIQWIDGYCSLIHSFQLKATTDWLHPSEILHESHFPSCLSFLSLY